MRHKYLFKTFMTVLACMGISGSWAQETVFDYTGGLQTYVVPADAPLLQIEVRGAQGGNGGGLGAVMIGSFLFSPGEELTILVGQQGGMNSANQVGGGGGSFVVSAADEPIIIAGGGGGRAWDGSGAPSFPGIDANTTTNGNNGYSLHGGSPDRYGVGGVDGNGSTLSGPLGFGHAGNGGGFYTSGSGGACGGNGASYLAGGAGGTGCSGGPGGYGGGANGGNWGGGGGGGYSGGGGSWHGPTNGGGGGSFNSGDDQENSVENEGNGQVIVRILCNALSLTVSDYGLCLGESFTAEAVSESGADITWDGGLENGVEFTPGAAGLYTFNAVSSDPDDCGAQIEILVNEYPEVLAGVSDATICLGSEVVFAGSGADTYDWDMGVTDGVPFEPGGLGTETYTVTGYDEIGCSSTASVDVTVDPVPVVVASASETELCEGETLIFSISGDADSYEWDPADIVPGVPYAPADGVETFTLTGYFDETGCSTEDVVTITLNPTPFVTASAGDGIFCADEMVVLAAGGDADIYTWDPTDLEPGIGTHTYTVTGIYDGIEGCPATASVEVNVVGTPSVTASADNEAICLGQAVTLNGGGASFYEWDPETIMDGVPFTPEMTGTFEYTVTGEDSFGCTSEATITVMVAELMTLTYDTTMPMDGDDGEIDLTVTGGVAPFTFDWSNDGTGDFDDDEDLTGIGSGAYTVTVQGASGCTEELVIYLRSQAGIEGNTLTNLNVYPNPTSDFVTISSEGFFNYEITSINGAILYAGSATDNENVDLSEFAKGVYFVRVASNDKTAVIKVEKL